MNLHRRTTVWIALSVAVMAIVSTSAHAQTPGERAATYLANTLNDPDTSAIAMASLASLTDDDLKPIFAALATSKDRDTRLFAIAAIPAALGDEGHSILRDRLANDPLMIIRAEALSQLITADSIGIETLRIAMRTDDQTIQLLAARALMKEGDDNARQTLLALVDADDRDLAANARLALLAAGDDTQLPELKTYIAGLETDETASLAVELTLAQIRDQAMAEGLPLVEQVLTMDSPGTIITRQAYRALAAIDNTASKRIAGAIEATDQPDLKLMLFDVLADQPDAPKYCQRFSQSTDDLIATLAEFEMARLGSSDEAPDLIENIITDGTPYLVNYVLKRAGEDIRNEHPNVAMYVTGLIACVDAANPEAEQMSIQHVQAAQSANMLLDIGTDDAMAAVAAILSQQHNSTVRAVAAGTLRTENADVCDLMAPLLASPYKELWTDAALVLGRFGDDRAWDRLQQIVDSPSRYGPLMTTQASWYIMKLDVVPEIPIQSVADSIE